LKLPELRIGHLVAKIPIIQGGMAVRISTGRLAAAVAKEGGIGVIAASGMTLDELRNEIGLARSLSGGQGIIGINAMVAARCFLDLIKTAMDAGIDLIIAGAGFSRDMFAVGREHGVPIVPIVASVKAARISQTLGAAAVIVEGKEAGGHLGTDQPMHVLVPAIKKSVSIPVIAAGGIINGHDIVEAFKLGADGVQMGTRFAASEESAADPAFKNMYVNAKKEDIVMIHSPVGLPGQAIINPFAEKTLAGTAPKPEKCMSCLKHCEQNFCIIDALNRAQQGDVETGLVFAGEHVYRINDVLPVKEIFRRLLQEVEINN